MLTESDIMRILFVIKYVYDGIHQILLEQRRHQPPRIMDSSTDNRTGRVWMHPRYGEYWEKDVAEYNNVQWIENFRLTKETFMELLNLIYEDMRPDDVTVRKPIPTDKRTAIAIYMLASSAEYRTVAHIFGVSKSSVCRCLKRFCQAINKQLHVFISWPKPEEAEEIAMRIQRHHHFPQVVGCVDGTHIPVTAPCEGKKDYTNRKGWDSIILQAVVDDRYMFRDINVKWPGSTHDAAVFTESGVFKHHEKLPKASIWLNGVEIPQLILGDPAYPLLPWLIKPFIGFGLPPDQESFNVYHSSVRICVENAFGRLKARWRILGKKIGASIDMVPEIVSTCCAMHNLCEKNAIAIPQQIDQNHCFPQPPTHSLSQSENQHNDGARVRQAIVQHLADTQPLRMSFRR